MSTVDRGVVETIRTALSHGDDPWAVREVERLGAGCQGCRVVKRCAT